MLLMFIIVHMSYLNFLRRQPPHVAGAKESRRATHQAQIRVIVCPKLLLLKKLINEGCMDAEDRGGKGASTSYHASMDKKRRRKGKEAMRESGSCQAPSFGRGRGRGQKSTKAKANMVLLD
jgi:hypothetical protein